MADETYTVVRSATIDASPERIYGEIIDFHHWPAWSPWEDLDPQMTRKYSGAEAGPGAVYTWEGNRRAGKGRMEIAGVNEPSSVKIDLDFEKPFKAHNETVFSIEPSGSGTRVVWSLTGKKTLMTKIVGIFKAMDSLVGPDFERGLARLKTLTETTSH